MTSAGDRLDQIQDRYEQPDTLVALATAGVRLYEAIYTHGPVKDMPNEVKKRYAEMQKLLRRLEKSPLATRLVEEDR